MKKLIIVASLILAPVVFAIAQPQPSQQSGGGAVGGGPIGGAAPIGSGIVMLLTMAIGYGSKKVFDARKKLAE